MHARHYLPWARHLGGEPPRSQFAEATPGRCPPAVEITVDVAVFGVALRDLDDRMRWRNGTATRVLVYSLMLYADIAGWERNRLAIAEFEDGWDVRRNRPRAIKPPLTGSGLAS